MMKNILLCTLPAWGHLKPLIALIVLIAERRPDVVMTLPVSIMYTKIIDELGKLSKERLEKVQERIRIVQIPHPGFPETLLDNPDMNAALRKLYWGQEVICIATGKAIRCMQKPDLVIIDLIAGAAYQTIRSLDPERTVPIIAWNTMLTGPIAGMFGPEELGGRGNVNAKIQALVEKGVDAVEAAQEVILSTKDQVVRIRGYPPLYDYEIYPQDVDVSSQLQILPLGWTVLSESQGIISMSARFLEDETVDAVQEYYGSEGQYTLPSLAFLSATMVHSEGENAKDESGAMAFLDTIAREVGRKSLIYISFGSYYWPPQPEKLVVVLEELMASRTPFLLGRASPLATLPDNILKEIEVYDIGMVMDWTPQDAILQHPATGWFLTHGGWNSAQEAIKYRVPQIFWPISADQPVIASLMSIKHRIGFELISVRSGIGARIPYRLQDQVQEVQFTTEAVRDEFRQMLMKLRGEEGHTARMAIERMGDQADEWWVKGGEAEAALQAFLVNFLG